MKKIKWEVVVPIVLLILFVVVTAFTLLRNDNQKGKVSVTVSETGSGMTKFVPETTESGKLQISNEIEDIQDKPSTPISVIRPSTFKDLVTGIVIDNNTTLKLKFQKDIDIRQYVLDNTGFTEDQLSDCSIVVDTHNFLFAVIDSAGTRFNFKLYAYDNKFYLVEPYYLDSQNSNSHDTVDPNGQGDSGDYVDTPIDYVITQDNFLSVLSMIASNLDFDLSIEYMSDNMKSAYLDFLNDEVNREQFIDSRAVSDQTGDFAAGTFSFKNIDTVINFSFTLDENGKLDSLTRVSYEYVG